MTSTQSQEPEDERHDRMLHASAPPDFLQPMHEWRRLFSEAWGTFLLVVVAAGAGVIEARTGGEITLSMKVVAPGMMVTAIIYFMGAVGGAHLNPAVTLAFAVRRNFPWARVPGYIAVQLAGGIAAACFLRAMFGTAGLLGATTPGLGVSDLKALIMEILLTTGLVNVILGTATGARNIGSNGALAVGSYIALAGLWSAPISGASMNPVRSFAPDLIRGDLHTTWIYIVGPIVGAMIAVGFEWIKKGRATIIKMRSRIAKHGPKPSVIITSPLVRAVQTAEILAEKLGKKNTVIATGLLNPDADIEQFIKHLKKQNDDDCMMIVGHEPFLGSLVTKLLGQPDDAISLKKGSCVALKIQFDKKVKSKLLWYMVPGQKRIVSC
jgi:aquaporin Z